MASKLFRAVVGFGISLGAASAACMGAVDEVATTNDGGASRDGAASSTSPPPAPSPPPSTDDGAAAVPADAGVDVALDAPKDVGPDAFCDAAWPTTKGNPGPPKCVDPDGACADAGHPTYCWKDDGTGACDFGQSYAPFCVGKQWECQSGTIPSEKCP